MGVLLLRPGGGVASHHIAGLTVTARPALPLTLLLLAGPVTARAALRVVGVSGARDTAGQLGSPLLTD